MVCNRHIGCWGLLVCRVLNVESELISWSKVCGSVVGKKKGVRGVGKFSLWVLLILGVIFS